MRNIEHPTCGTASSRYGKALRQGRPRLAMLRRLDLKDARSWSDLLNERSYEKKVRQDSTSTPRAKRASSRGAGDGGQAMKTRRHRHKAVLSELLLQSLRGSKRQPHRHRYLHPHDLPSQLQPDTRCASLHRRAVPHLRRRLRDRRPTTHGILY